MGGITTSSAEGIAASITDARNCLHLLRAFQERIAGAYMPTQRGTPVSIAAASSSASQPPTRDPSTTTSSTS
jgi:hypothetical protein